jgi:alpha-L-fucosidase 2
MAPYQSFGDIFLDFPQLASASNYRRELDLEEAISRVSYSVDSTQYTREYFVSYPDNVLAVRLSSSSAGKVSVDVSVANAHSGATTASGDTLTISGKLDLLSYEAQLRVVNEGGSIATNNNKISVRSADAVTLLLAAGTDYDASAPTYKGESPHGVVGPQIASAAQKSYSALRSIHIADYQALFDRVSLSLGETTPTTPTPDVISKYNAGSRAPFLEVLYFQFGRYLTLSSSRGLGLPSNLQGIWNNDNNPPWSCDIHDNINVQMNYWPADPTNLPECFAPYSDWLYTQAVTRESWKSNASAKGYGGFSMYTQNNIFGFSNWEYNPEANAWFGQALWDHYRFTQDASYLKDKVYPFLKGASDYWLSALITDGDGKLVAPNSFSPEHGNPMREKGTTYAQTLIHQLFTNTIEASQLLGEDSAYRSTMQAKLGQLDPGLRLGANVSANGACYGPLLREWKYQNDQLGEQHSPFGAKSCAGWQRLQAPDPGLQEKPRPRTA